MVAAACSDSDDDAAPSPATDDDTAVVKDDGTLIMYDNGNMRPGTTVGGGTAPPFSRAVQYEIDVDAGTATQLWEHRDT